MPQQLLAQYSVVISAMFGFYFTLSCCLGTVPAHLRVGELVPSSKVPISTPFSFNLLGVHEPSTLEFVNLKQQSQGL
jgi:hypothetical protein